MSERNFEGKVIVITGASSGFGKGALSNSPVRAQMWFSPLVAIRRTTTLPNDARRSAAGGNRLRQGVRNAGY